MIEMSDFISQRFVYALGWTIIHSLWQSSLIALAYFFLSSFPKKENSHHRYNLGIFSLIILLGTTAMTFWRAHSSFVPASMTANTAVAQGSTMLQAGSDPSLASIVQGFISQHMPLIVGFWLLGVFILIVHFIGDYVANLRIKKYPCVEAPDLWQKRLTDLSKRMNLSKFVKIKETLRISTPMTIGHLKPVILFPVGLLAGLPVDQVEAIFAHELAHILRRDYLVNILQNFVDIFFFYHPGVRWISARIRVERENCCDDMAVGMVGDSIMFAKALANIQGWHIKQPLLAMNVIGKRDKLFNRIRRVTKMQQKGTRSTEGLVGACVLGLFLVFAGIGINAASLVSETGGDGSVGIEKKVALKTKALKVEAKVQLSVAVKSDVKGLIKCVIIHKESGKKVYHLKEKLDGNPFYYVSDVVLKPGTYDVSWTDNCQVKLRKKVKGGDQVDPMEILQKYKAKINQMKIKEGKLTDEEKKKLHKLEFMAQKLATEIKKKAEYKKYKHMKMSKKSQKEVQGREQEIKKLYMVCKEIKSKGDAMTQKDKDKLKKCEIMIKEHRMVIKKIQFKEQQ